MYYRGAEGKKPVTTAFGQKVAEGKPLLKAEQLERKSDDYKKEKRRKMMEIFVSPKRVPINLCR